MCSWMEFLILPTNEWSKVEEYNLNELGWSKVTFIRILKLKTDEKDYIKLSNIKTKLYTDIFIKLNLRDINE